MLLQTRSILSVISRRWIFASPRANKFLPHEILVSDLVSDNGLIPEKGEVKTKKKIFDEDDHISTKPNCYGSINFTIEGFDIVVIEKFAQSVHKLALKSKINVTEMYALPTEFVTVKHIGEEFTTVAGDMQVDAELPLHTRVIQVHDMQAVAAPIIIQTLASEVPPGVKLSIREHKEEDYLKRHKENKELLDAKYEYQKMRYGR